MNKDKALDLALEFFETMQRYKGTRSNIFIRFEPTATGDYVDLREFNEKAKPIITAIKQSRSAPVQEPVETEDTMFRQFMSEANKAGVTHWPTSPEAPVQEPVAQGSKEHLKIMMEEIAWEGRLELSDALANIDEFYTTPPAAQRQWVGLTDEEIDLFINGRGDEHDDDYVEPTGDGFGLTDADLVELVRRAEAKLKERNT